MTDAAGSQQLTLDLNSLFSVGTGTDRFDPLAWLNDGPGHYEPIFSQTLPLQVDDVTLADQITPTGSWGIPSVSIAFTPAGKVTRQGTPIDVYLRDALRCEGRMITSVDTLSRSIQLIDLDPHTVMDALGTEPAKPAENQQAVHRAIRAWRFDHLDDPAATQARQLLIENVRRHERTHVTYSITPQTALWKELELHYRWVLLSADPSIWSNHDFVGRFLARYGTPSTYISELLAILTEDYTTADPAIRHAVETRVAAHQGGAVGALLDCLRCHEIDTDALFETLHSRVGEQYCDLWLAYVLDAIRHGKPLAEVDADAFLETVDAAAATDDGVIIGMETRTELRALFDEVALGPVVEVVQLTDANGSVALERTWYSMAPNATATEQLLAVRRALFRRLFFYAFQSATDIDEILRRREAAIERVIWGAALDDVMLYDAGFPSTARLAEYGRSAHETARTAILGPDATSEQLDTWLNDPTYGFDAQYSSSFQQRPQEE